MTMTDQTAEAVERLKAHVEWLTCNAHNLEDDITPGEPNEPTYRETVAHERQAAEDISTLLADRERLRLALVAFYADMQPTADKAGLGRLLQGFGMGNAPRSSQPTVNVADFVAALNTQGEG